MAFFQHDMAPDPDQCPYDILGMAIDGPGPHLSSTHQHACALIMFCTRGVMETQIGRRYCLLSLAAWFP